MQWHYVDENNHPQPAVLRFELYSIQCLATLPRPWDPRPRSELHFHPKSPVPPQSFLSKLRKLAIKAGGHYQQINVRVPGDPGNLQMDILLPGGKHKATHCDVNH